MRAGVLRHRILVESPIRSQNATGEEVIVWQVAGKVWGSIEPMSGRERVTASQTLTPFDTRIVIRWSPWMAAMDRTWRLTHQGIVYNIYNIDEVNMARREIDIDATSGVNLG